MCPLGDAKIFKGRRPTFTRFSVRPDFGFIRMIRRFPLSDIQSDFPS